MTNPQNRTPAYPRYWAKFPRQSFEQRRPTKGWTTDAARMARQIEDTYRSGHTGEPYIQLVEETADGYQVIAEWMPGRGWINVLEAAGFLPHTA